MGPCTDVAAVQRDIDLKEEEARREPGVLGAWDKQQTAEDDGSALQDPLFYLITDRSLRPAASVGRYT